MGGKVAFATAHLQAAAGVTAWHRAPSTSDLDDTDRWDSDELGSVLQGDADCPYQTDLDDHLQTKEIEDDDAFVRYLDRLREETKERMVYLQARRHPPLADQHLTVADSRHAKETAPSPWQVLRQRQLLQERPHTTFNLNHRDFASTPLSELERKLGLPSASSCQNQLLPTPPGKTLQVNAANGHHASFAGISSFTSTITCAPPSVSKNLMHLDTFRHQMFNDLERCAYNMERSWPDLMLPSTSPSFEFGLFADDTSADRGDHRDVTLSENID